MIATKKLEFKTWRSEMGRTGLDGWSNYSGPEPEIADWIIVCSQGRDSEMMQASNFDCALEQLGGQSDHVKIERFGHWACGWFELLCVNPKSKRKSKIAYDILKALDNYPVLDESDYYERETEYQTAFAESAKNDLAESLSKHFSVKNTRELKALALELNTECQRYYGNDSCVDIYPMRTPDERDIKRLTECMRQLSYYDKKSKAFQSLAKALGMNEARSA